MTSQTRYEIIWRLFLWRVFLFRTDATDEGWMYNGRVVNFFVRYTAPTPSSRALAIVLWRRRYIVGLNFKNGLGLYFRRGSHIKRDPVNRNIDT